MTEEEQYWEKVLKDNDLSMSRGSSRIHYFTSDFWLFALRHFDYSNKTGNEYAKRSPSQAAKEVSARPEIKELRRKNGRKVATNPALRARSIAAMAKLWADPVFKARRSVEITRQNLELWKDPDYRKRQIASRTKYSAATCCPERPNRSKGLCDKCYMRQYRAKKKSGSDSQS